MDGLPRPPRSTGFPFTVRGSRFFSFVELLMLDDDDDDDDASDPPGVFLPTEQEIRDACLAIQATWTPTERRSRRSLSANERVQPVSPLVRRRAEDYVQGRLLHEREHGVHG